MKLSLLPLFLAAISTGLLADEYRPELFRTVKLLYQDDFSRGTIDTNHWQVRQGTTWQVKEGVLVGAPSPKEYQAQKVAEGDRAHAGFKPVIWLEKIPEDLVVQFRVRFDADDYQPKFPLIDVGHHVNTLTFSAKETVLVLKKNQQTIKNEGVLFPLNRWVHVTLELKKGALLFKADNTKTLFRDPLIDMVGQQQIDFKGIDHGGIRIDDVKVYQGIE